MLRSFLYHLSLGTCFTPPPPTPLQIAVSDLEQAQKDLLEHSAEAEFQNGMVKVCNTRIERLNKDIARLTPPPPSNSEPAQ